MLRTCTSTLRIPNGWTRRVTRWPLTTRTADQDPSNGPAASRVVADLSYFGSYARLGRNHRSTSAWSMPRLRL